MRRRRHLSTGAFAAATWHRAPPSYTGWQEVAHSLASTAATNTQTEFLAQAQFLAPIAKFLHVLQIFFILLFPSSHLSAGFTFCLALLWAQSSTDFSIARVFTRSFQHHLRCPRHAHDHVHMLKKSKLKDTISIVHLELYLGHTR